LTTLIQKRKICPMSELLTTGQVADLVGVNRTTVHHWAKDGKLPIAGYANNIRLFNRADVDKFTDARTEVAS
jgi:excisionase family DNA binding protein